MSNPSTKTTIPKGKSRLCVNITALTERQLTFASEKHGIAKTEIVEKALRLYLSNLLTSNELSDILSDVTPAN